MTYLLAFVTGYAVTLTILYVVDPQGLDQWMDAEDEVARKLSRRV